MKVIQIDYDANGSPTVNPGTEVCFAGEVLAWVVVSRNEFIEAINLAFGEHSARFFCCPSGGKVTREFWCQVDLEDSGQSPPVRCAVIWGIAPNHTTDPARMDKYTITPFVNGGPYPRGQVDPYIVTTKRP